MATSSLADVVCGLAFPGLLFHFGRMQTPLWLVMKGPGRNPAVHLAARGSRR